MYWTLLVNGPIVRYLEAFQWVTRSGASMLVHSREVLAKGSDLVHVGDLIDLEWKS